MTELSFSKQFLTLLDTRPQKLSSDHIVDPKTYAAQPASILPRMPVAKKRRTTTTTTPSAPGTPTTSSTTVTATLKPTRGTFTPLTLPQTTLTTSIHALKTAYAAHARLPADKIKLLHAKKPVSDTKTLRDVLGDTQAEAVELTVMVLGGATSAPASAAQTPLAATPERVASPPASAPAPVSVPVDGQPTVETSAPVGAGDVAGEATPMAGSGATGAAVLEGDAFWEDLRGFLVQRVRDEGEAGRLAGLFRGAWKGASA